MGKQLIASWNIAGGYPIKSSKQFDYSSENISYFISQLRKINPDIVCLQETHTSLDDKRILALEIAKGLGFKYILNTPASPSHINPAYKLGNAIISKHKFINEVVHWFPDPEMELFFKDGRKAITHKKNMQIVRLENFYISNCQMLPISMFGYKYDDGAEGTFLAEGISGVMHNLQSPVILSGDFNFNNPKSIYPRLSELGLEDSLPDKSTKPTSEGDHKTPDHIYSTPDFDVVDADIIETDTDHYLCYADFLTP